MALRYTVLHGSAIGDLLCCNRFGITSLLCCANEFDAGCYHGLKVSRETRLERRKPMSTGPAGNGTPERTSKEKPTEENLGVTLPVPQAPVVPNPEGSTPLWATVLLGRVQGGKSIDSARQLPGSRVSRETIATYGTQNRNWYRSLMDAQSGALVGSPTHPKPSRVRGQTALLIEWVTWRWVISMVWFRGIRSALGALC